MKKKYYLVGLILIVLLVGLVNGINALRPPKKAIEIEPWKIKGNPEAPLFIIEFTDYACPYCKDIQPIFDNLLKAYPGKLKIILKHFPLEMHKNSYAASVAAECAAAQNSFWEYSNILFDQPMEWHEPKDPKPIFSSYAKKIGLDEKKLLTCIDSKEKNSIVDKNMAEAKNYLISVTPSCILNGNKIITRPNNEAYMKKLIEANLQ